MESAQKRKAQKVFARLLKDNANKVCIECGDFNPQWASVTNAVVFCLNCAGKHRGMGVHISFVRSVNLDEWDDKQLGSMKAGGNGKLQQFWKDQGFSSSLSIKQKYDNKAMVEYRKQILNVSQGGKWERIGRMGYQPHERKKKTKQSMSGGFGSAPKPAPQSDPWADWFNTVGDLTKSVTETVGKNVASGASSLSQKVQTIDTEDLSNKVKDGWSSFSGWVSTAAERTFAQEEEEDIGSILRKNLGGGTGKKMGSLSSREVMQSQRKPMPSLSSESLHRKPMPSLSSESLNRKPMPSLSSESLKRKKMPSLSSDSIRNVPERKNNNKTKSIAKIVDDEDEDDLDDFGFDDELESEEESEEIKKVTNHTKKITLADDDDEDFDLWGWSDDEAATEI